MYHTILLFGLGGLEIVLIALVVLVLFGAKKIPELMKGFGKGVKDMKDEFNGVTDGLDDIKSDISEGVDLEPTKSRRKNRRNKKGSS
jgi:sec-independent protein translocase protein TatA